MPQLTELTDIWRMVGTYDQGKTLQAVYTRVPCLRVPISSFNTVASSMVARNTGSTERFQSEGYQATDLFLIPSWVAVQADDELRRGRYIDITGVAVAYRYTVNGTRSYDSVGYQDTIAVFCSITR